MPTVVIDPIFGGTLGMTGDSSSAPPPPNPVEVWDYIRPTWTESESTPGTPTTTYTGTNASGASIVGVECATTYDNTGVGDPYIITATIKRGYIVFPTTALDPTKIYSAAVLRINGTPVTEGQAFIVAWRGGTAVATPGSLVPATDWLTDVESSDLFGAGLLALFESAMDTDLDVLLCFRSPSDVNNVKEYGTGFTGNDIAEFSIELTYTDPIPTTTFSFFGVNANKLMGSDTSMVFRAGTSGDWIAVTGADMDLTAYTAAIVAAGGVIQTAYAAEVDKETNHQTLTVALPFTVSLVFTGANAYKLIGTTPDHEFTVTGGVPWFTCSNDTDITGLISTLQPDTPVLVRWILWPDDTTSLPVAPTEVTFSFDGANAMKLMGSTGVGTLPMEYSIEGGTTYTACGEDTDLAEFLNTADWTNDIRIRYIGAENPYVILLDDPPAAPEVEFVID